VADKSFWFVGSGDNRGVAWKGNDGLLFDTNCCCGSSLGILYHSPGSANRVKQKLSVPLWYDEAVPIPAGSWKAAPVGTCGTQKSTPNEFWFVAEENGTNLTRAFRYDGASFTEYSTGMISKTPQYAMGGWRVLVARHDTADRPVFMSRYYQSGWKAHIQYWDGSKWVLEKTWNYVQPDYVSYHSPGVYCIIPQNVVGTDITGIVNGANLTLALTNMGLPFNKQGFWPTETGYRQLNLQYATSIRGYTEIAITYQYIAAVTGSAMYGTAMARVTGATSCAIIEANMHQEFTGWSGPALVPWWFAYLNNNYWGICNQHSSYSTTKTLRNITLSHNTDRGQMDPFATTAGNRYIISKQDPAHAYNCVIYDTSSYNFLAAGSYDSAMTCNYKYLEPPK